MQSKGGAISKRLALTLCVAGMAAAVVPLAEAHTKHIPSQHQMGFTPDVASDVFTGTVSSAAGACVRNRSITLFRKVGGASDPDAAIETASTNSGGIWSQGFSNAQEGNYYAVAAKKVVKRPGHRHICDAAKSNTVKVDVDPADEDIDADTYTPNQGDCDDDNPAVNPDATEVENLIDDDCDGEVDEGFDADGDGFTATQGDCDDDNSAVNPDATEVANEIDDDCDGQVDESTNPDDQDSDGAPDSTDNCPSVANPAQEDADADGKGNVCDACPQDANPGAEPCPEPPEMRLWLRPQ